jgi:hypothetical protein
MSAVFVPRLDAHAIAGRRDFRRVGQLLSFLVSSQDYWSPDDER